MASLLKPLVIVVSAALAQSLVASSAHAQERAVAVVDPATGRDLLNYPKSPVVEYRHMRLALDIPDMNVPRATATQTLTIAPIAKRVSTLTLDANLLEIRSVESPGRLVGFTHDGRQLTITFDPPIEPRERVDVVTSYAINDPAQGIVWTLPDSATPGLAAQLHTQGQAELNSSWFPIHDFPNTRLTTEIIVTVPQGFTALSNGRLVTPPSTSNGRTTFHWLQDLPHAPYLISLIVGEFEIVDVARREKGDVPMPVYVPRGRGRDVQGTFGRTPEMAALFARLLDEPYPWSQYAQAVVRNFESGGMENTSATTLHEHTLLAASGLADQDEDDLISHELAHQWMGDLLTCKSWEHLWLNEGFATYFEALWAEERRGADGYLAAILGNLDALAMVDRAAAPSQPAMVSRAYDAPDDTFGKASSPYSKGSLVLHMLRQRLGDVVFWRGVRTYVDRFKFKAVETGDFRRVLEEVSGESLEQFFAQWTARPGIPLVSVQVQWEASKTGSGGDLVLTARQTQNIDENNPPFVLELPVWIGTGGPNEWLAPMQLKGAELVARYSLAKEPDALAIDPMLTSPAVVRTQDTPRRLETTMRVGPTLIARARATRELGDDATPSITASLATIANSPLIAAPLRVEAVRTLARRGNAAEVLALATSPVASADVRLATVEALERIASLASTDLLSRERAGEVLKTAASGEPFGRARASALKAIGRLKLAGADAILAKAADSDSDGDRVRRGAIEGLVGLGSPSALPIVVRHALPGNASYTRARAIRAIGELAHQDPVAATAVLCNVLNDRTRMVWTAAGDALAAIGTADALKAIESRRARTRDAADLERLDDWAASIRARVSLDAPAATAGPGLRWVPLLNPEAWADSPAQRDKILADPAAYFKLRGSVVEPSRGNLLMLVSDAQTLDGLLVANASLVESEGRVRAISVALDAGSSDRVVAFTREMLGGKLAIVVEGRVAAAPTVMSPLSGVLLITGEFSRADASRLKSALERPGALSLLRGVRVGEVSGEAELRAAVRGSGQP